MKARNTFVVLNPVSGTGDAETTRQRIFDALTAEGSEVTIHQTAEDDNVPAIVRERISEGYDLIVAAGGDGTTEQCKCFAIQESAKHVR